MRKLRLIFSTIKEHYARQGADPQPYTPPAAQKAAAGKRQYYPLVVYLDVLHHMGLTKPYEEIDGSTLTPKGLATNAEDIKGITPALWLGVYFIKRSLLLAPEALQERMRGKEHAQ